MRRNLERLPTASSSKIFFSRKNLPFFALLLFADPHPFRRGGRVTPLSESSRSHTSSPQKFFVNARALALFFFKRETIMFATHSLTNPFSSTTTTTTSSSTRKQQKQYRRRNQITRASSANVEKAKESPPPTSSASAPTVPPNPPKKEDRKIVNGQDVPSFEDISTAHFRISSGTFPLSSSLFCSE